MDPWGTPHWTGFITEKYCMIETGSRTQDLSFNVRALYHFSYLDRILFCYLNSGFILITRASYVCMGRCVVQGGTCMQVATWVPLREAHDANSKDNAYGMSHRPIVAGCLVCTMSERLRDRLCDQWSRREVTNITENYWLRPGVEPKVSRLTYEHSTNCATSIVNFSAI